MKPFFRKNINRIGIKTLLLSTLGILAIINDFGYTGWLLILTSIYLIIVIAFLKVMLLKKRNSWLKHHKIILLVLISIVLIAGIIESNPNQMLIKLILAELLVLIYVYTYFEFRIRNNINENISMIKKWGLLRFCFRMFFIAITVLLFFSVLYQYNPLGNIFDPYYFIILFGFLIDVLVDHINTTIRLKNEQTQAELLHLRSQSNPHFFFNTLNNLYGLTIKNSKQAPEVILKLSEMMRYTIYQGEKSSVTIKNEITYLENYIELHKIRYKKSVLITFNHTIDETLTIAPLLSINLLENAFKHGVDTLEEDAFIKISLTSDAKVIYFFIENNFDETEKNQTKGIGLTNLKRRLSLLYPKKHTLKFTRLNNIYNVTLKISL